MSSVNLNQVPDTNTTRHCYVEAKALRLECLK